MEIVTHLINDTIELYKWTLTIAGNNHLVFEGFKVLYKRQIHMCVFLYSMHTSTGCVRMRQKRDDAPVGFVFNESLLHHRDEECV